MTSAQLLNSLMPLWMQRIKDFERIAIKPCEIVGYTCALGPITQSCKPEQASFWTVYGYYKSNEVHNAVYDFEDFGNEYAAQRFHNWLLKVYPHLMGNRISI